MWGRIILAVATAAILVSHAFGSEAIEPRLMEAVRIYTLYRTTEQFAATCKKWESQTYPAVEAAVNQLLEKHSERIQEANRVLGEAFWREQRGYLDAGLTADKGQLEERFQNAPEALRRDWCEKFPERIELADRALSEKPQ